MVPAVAIICAVILSGCQGSTIPATNVGTTTATFNAQASCSGGVPTPCSWYWRWGTNGNYQYSSAIAGPFKSTYSGTLSYTATGLTPNTTYSYELCGEGDNISVFVCLTSANGTTNQFTTLSTGSSSGGSSGSGSGGSGSSGGGSTGYPSGSPYSSNFPIAVWEQEPENTTAIESGYSSLATAAKAEGINTFLGLYNWPSTYGTDANTGGSSGELQAACNAGENVIAGGDPSSNTSAESVASVDKIAAGETQAGTGTPCTKYLVGYDWDDEPAECSTNVAAQVAAIHAEDPTRPTVDNMASWVTWDASGCDSTANAAFAAPSYPSSDDYHNTDAWNTDSCKAAAHVSTSPWADCSWLYGYQGAVQTSLAGGKPTWEYIETGTDELGFSSQNGSSCNTTTNACSNGNEYNATAPQVNVDAWDAILNGVSGIEWFCHGTAQGQNLATRTAWGATARPPTPSSRTSSTSTAPSRATPPSS